MLVIGAASAAAACAWRPPPLALSRRAVVGGALASRLFEAPAAYAEAAPVLPVLAAQSNLRWLSNAEDVATFKTMLKIGLPITPTSQLQTPPIIQFALFKAIEPTLPERDAGPFMDAAIEYVEYTRDADDLVSLAIGAKRQNAPLDIVDDYVERAIAAAQGAKRAVDRMVPLLPGV